MMLRSATISGTHRTQLYSDVIHSTVVVIVVLATAALAVIDPSRLPPDVLGTVFGGAIGFAAGRAGNVARTGMTEESPYVPPGDHTPA